MKIVINACFGGFSLSPQAIMRYAEIKGIRLWAAQDKYGFAHYYTVPPEERTPEVDGAHWAALTLAERKALNAQHSIEYFSHREIGRDDPALVQTVEEMGAEANGRFAHLQVVEIPDDVEWHIHEYDGSEHVAEDHRTWG